VQTPDATILDIMSPLNESKQLKLIQLAANRALAAVPPRHEAAIIAGESGQKISPVYFGDLIAAAIEKAGLPTDCILHGLRKTAGRLLAEAGAQVAPITGHRTERMTAEYSRDANQAKLARASVLKWSRSTKQKNKAGK
jgi:integrase